jgi:glycosyltransferase involved in cell wall biosynthesis
MKILFIATHPFTKTGYSKIAYILSNTLSNYKPNTEISYLALDLYDEELLNERKMNTNIKIIPRYESIHTGKVYNDINNIVMYEKPDVIFLYNDLIVCCNIFNKLLEINKNLYKFKVITYLDLVYPYQKYLFINHINNNSNKILVFSDYWKNNLIDMKINENKIEVLEHPIYNKLFKVLNSRELLNLDEEDFIILNLNRNTYRKCWDITIKSFLIFLKNNNFNKNIKLYIKCDLKNNSGYNILEMIKTYTIMMNISNYYEKIINFHILTINNKTDISDKIINLIYNSCDIGINTCCGEGFGLCNMEHAYLGKPQIVSNVGGLSDIFSNNNSIKIDSCYQLTCCDNIDEHTGELYYTDPNEFAKGLQFYYENQDKRKEYGEKISTHIKNKYTIDNFNKKIYKILDEI